MATKYEFRFDKFTVLHLAALTHQDNSFKFAAIDDLTIGGLYTVPVVEVVPLLCQFVQEYGRFAEMLKAHNADSAAQDDANLSDLLDGIEGL